MSKNVKFSYTYRRFCSFDKRIMKVFLSGEDLVHNAQNHQICVLSKFSIVETCKNSLEVLQ